MHSLEQLSCLGTAMPRYHQMPFFHLGCQSCWWSSFIPLSFHQGEKQKTFFFLFPLSGKTPTPFQQQQQGHTGMLTPRSRVAGNKTQPFVCDRLNVKLEGKENLFVSACDKFVFTNPVRFLSRACFPGGWGKGGRRNELFSSGWIGAGSCLGAFLAVFLCKAQMLGVLLFLFLFIPKITT